MADQMTGNSHFSFCAISVVVLQTGFESPLQVMPFFFRREIIIPTVSLKILNNFPRWFCFQNPSLGSGGSHTCSSTSGILGLCLGHSLCSNAPFPCSLLQWLAHFVGSAQLCSALSPFPVSSKKSCFVSATFQFILKVTNNSPGEHIVKYAGYLQVDF